MSVYVFTCVPNPVVYDRVGASKFNANVMVIWVAPAAVSRVMVRAAVGTLTPVAGLYSSENVPPICPVLVPEGFRFPAVVPRSPPENMS